MQFKLDTVKAKDQAKRLAEYLTSINRTICHGNALDAVARMYGSKDWNVLAASLSEGGDPPSGIRYLAHGAGATFKLAVQATARAGSMRAAVDAAAWLAVAEPTAVLELQQRSWCESDDDGNHIAEFFRSQGHQEVDNVWIHWLSTNSTRMPLSKVQLRVEIDEQDALAFCRAFRYPLFVKLMLLKQYGDFDAVNDIGGIDVMPDADQPGRWAFRIGAEGSDISYDTEDEAFAALGKCLEDGFATFMPGASFFDIQPGSGTVVEGASPPAGDAVPGRHPKYASEADKAVVLVLKPGQAPLSKKELRRITDDGEFYLHVAVPVDLEAMTGNGIEWLNDLCSELITGDENGLSDIGYERYAPANEAEIIDTKKMVLMTVTACWDPFDGMDDEENEGDASDGAGT